MSSTELMEYPVMESGLWRDAVYRGLTGVVCMSRLVPTLPPTPPTTRPSSDRLL